MRDNALILHAWKNIPSDYWYPWLAKELQNKGYTVTVPELPTMNTDRPDLAVQLKTVAPYVQENSLIIGHSLGSLLAMRLAEKFTFQKMILFAGWDFNDLTKEHQLFWKKPMNHKAIQNHVKEIYCVTSDNDPYYTVSTVEDMSKRLDGKLIIVPGAGHFTSEYGVNTVPCVLSCI